MSIVRFDCKTLVLSILMLGLLMTIGGLTGCGGDDSPPLSPAVTAPVAPETPVKTKGKVSKKKVVDPDDVDDSMADRRARLARERAAREAAAKAQ